MVLRMHALDGGRLYFERESGVQVRLRGPAYASERRRAPAFVQIGLTNRCNMACSFCFRDKSLASTWTHAELLDWAKRLDALGVLELGFGQGEPLVFPEFPALVTTLARETSLALHFTTNGLALDDAMLDALAEVYGERGVGQLRLSWYDQSAPHERVRRLVARRFRFGINLLVTPARLPTLGATIDELVALGCRDLLLLAYNGNDAALHLDAGHDRALAGIVLAAHRRHAAALSLRLSACFGARLAEVPQLHVGASPDDCGAGDDFLAIDSHKRVLACSFHAHALALDSPDAALAVWREARALREHAGLRGCARAPFVPLRVRNELVAPHHDVEPSAIAWQAYASNNSTTFTLVGEFSSLGKSAEYIEKLELLIRRCSAADEAQREHGKPVPATLAELLGWSPERASHVFHVEPSDFRHHRPRTLLAGGRRAIVHDDSTLRRFPLFAHELLRGHGRVTWTPSHWTQEIELVFGLAPGDALPTIRPRLARHCQEFEVHGGRAYGIVREHAIDGVAVVLREFTRSIACVTVRETSLAQVLARAREPLQGRKQRIEWCFFPYLSLERWRERLDELRRDPAEVTARIDWPHPFRLPAKLDAHTLLHGTIVRSEGTPFPNVLQALFGDDSQLVDHPRLRVRVQVQHAPEHERPLGGLTPAHIEALSRPGNLFVAQPYETFVDILPRKPGPTFAQLTAILADLPRLGVSIMAEQPLAHAVALIDADLDEQTTHAP